MRELPPLLLKTQLVMKDQPTSIRIKNGKKLRPPMAARGLPLLKNCGRIQKLTNTPRIKLPTKEPHLPCRTGMPKSAEAEFGEILTAKGFEVNFIMQS